MRREEIHTRRRRRRIERRKNGRRKSERSERRKNERRKNMKIGENGRKESTTSTTAEGIKMMMMTTEGMREAIMNRIAIAFVRRAIIPLIATTIIVTAGLALRARDGLKCHIGKTSVRVSRTNLF